MADPTFINAPAQTIKKSFSVSGSTKGGGDTTATTVPPINTADLAPQTVASAGPSQNEIAQFFQPLLEHIQNEQTPASRPVPADVSPTGTFLGLLAGNLAATFAQNPAFAQQAHQYLAEQEQRRQTIQEQNYAQDLAFNAEKRNKLISIRGQILETQLTKAINDGNLVQANALSKELTKFQEGIKRESQREEAQQGIAKIQEQGRQERLTQAQKVTLTAKEEAAAAGKPITTKQYLDARNDVAKNKQLPSDITHTFFGLNNPWIGNRAPTPSDRELALEQIDVSTIKNGEPTATRGAKANLKRSILKRLNLLGTTASPQAREAVRAELEQYGLTPGDLL